MEVIKIRVFFFFGFNLSPGIKEKRYQTKMEKEGWIEGILSED